MIPITVGSHESHVGVSPLSKLSLISRTPSLNLKSCSSLKSADVNSVFMKTSYQLISAPSNSTVNDGLSDIAFLKHGALPITSC